MNLAIKKSLISIPLAICLAGCSITQSSTAIGASSGAVVGAVIGKQLGGDTGMVIGLGTGAIIGGIAGFFIGSYIEERREAQRKISQDKNTTIEFENLAKDNSSNIKDKAIISDKGQFKTKSAELSDDAREFYTLLAQTYKEKDKKILIVGHTDDTGDEKFNQSLSQRRAKVVAQIFAKNGVDIKNIYYQGAGSTKPKADNSTAQGREQNRRVEIVELDNTADVSLYASAATQNSHYLRKNQKPTQKIAQKQPSPKTQTKQTQTQTKVESQIAQTPTIPKFAPFQAKYAINFGGKPSKGGKLALKDEFGEIQSNGFLSLATQAKANPILLSCINTGYQNISNSPDVKSLADNKTLPKTSEYKKRLNGSAWMTPPPEAMRTS
ncbi:MAG: OmpA family protein [Campylobacter sp.]|nr:OmpA family protein [Campylobacter sp.]